MRTMIMECKWIHRPLRNASLRQEFQRRRPADESKAPLLLLFSLLGLLLFATACTGSARSPSSLEPGLSWRRQKAPGQSHLMAIAWSGSRFVAVGGDPTPVFTSPDGFRWSGMYPPGIGGLEDVIYADQFVAVGYARDYRPTIQTSQDGVTWKSARVPPIDVELEGVAWSGNRFVAVGDERLDERLVRRPIGADSAPMVRTSRDVHVISILTSADAVDWTSQAASTVQGGLQEVTWSGSQFVAVGNRWVGGDSTLPGLVLTSPDGTTWTPRDLPASDRAKSNVLQDIAWSGTVFVTVGWDGRGAIFSSPDAVTWTRRTMPVDGSLEGVAWGDGRFVAVGTVAGSGGNEGLILVSSDGIQWTRVPSPTRGHPRRVVWAGNKFVIVGQVRGYLVPSYSPLILTSP